MDYGNNPFMRIQTCKDSWLWVRQGGSLRKELSHVGCPCGGFSCQLSTNSVISSVSFPKQDTQSIEWFDNAVILRKHLNKHTIMLTRDKQILL